MRKLVVWLTTLAVAAMLVSGCGAKNEMTQAPKPAKAELILSTTTSTQDSGLLDVIIPAFERKTGYKVKTVAVGSGQAIAMGEKGEADVLLTHAPDAEKKTIAGGAVINRRMVMHNDFVIIGPSEDPGKIKGRPALEALKAISSGKLVFVSRGDNSGTHQLEKKLWGLVGEKASGAWYQEAATGMGQTIKIADEKKGYTITDRATFLAQKKNVALTILVEGDPKLLNIYHVMEVNAEKFAKVNKEGAKAFADFLLSAEGQDLIKNFGKDKYGQPLFFADGGKSEKDLGL